MSPAQKQKISIYTPYIIAIFSAFIAVLSYVYAGDKEQVKENSRCIVEVQKELQTNKTQTRIDVAILDTKVADVKEDVTEIKSDVKAVLKELRAQRTRK